MQGSSGADIRDRAMAGGEEARAAFQELWEAYYRRLSVFAASYRGLPAAERDDHVADALIASFCALASYDPRRPLGPWIYRIAANRFSDAVRRAAHVAWLPAGDSGSLDAIEPPAPGDHAQDLVDRDLADRCRSAIAALPELDRRIAMLRFYEDMGAADVGRALGMPAGTVRWRISAIRAFVKAAVGEDTP